MNRVKASDSYKKDPNGTVSQKTICRETGSETYGRNKSGLPLAVILTAFLCLSLLLSCCGRGGAQNKNDSPRGTQPEKTGENASPSGSAGSPSKEENSASDQGDPASNDGSTPSGPDSPEKTVEEDILEAVFFDVGKGDCILISSGDSHVLIDAGYAETSGQVVKELRERGIERLDAMIVTHYDKDHVGGAAEIASEIPVDLFYLPDYEGDVDKCGDLLDMIRQERLQAVTVSEDQTFSIGPAQCRVYAALVDYDAEEKNDNDASLIVEILWGEDEWLLPGDIEKEAIGVWLEKHPEQTYDVLKLPHHGRKEGNTKDLLKTVSPEFAVITDSTEEEANEKVLKRLEKLEADVYRSAKDGCITITGNGKEQYTVSTEN